MGRRPEALSDKVRLGSRVKVLEVVRIRDIAGRNTAAVRKNGQVKVGERSVINVEKRREEGTLFST